MNTAEDWNRSFLTVLPVVSAGFGAVSVAFAALALTRNLARRLSRGRVHYENGQYLVACRYLGRWYEIRDFIQPQNPDVLSIVSVYHDYWSLLDYVCRGIEYRRDFGEFWKYPSETLASSQGDCEDTTFLLCSLLRNSYDSHVVLGSYCGYGHAWCVLNGEILESTYTLARHVPDPHNYKPYIYFNEHEVCEVWPGALMDIYSVPRRETRKLRLMAGVRLE